MALMDEAARLARGILASIFTCPHAGARVVEGKTFCPDCGDGVIFRWVILRCGGCSQRRPAQYRFRAVVPAEPCCTFCGDRAVIHQTLDAPEFFQLRHALLAIEPAPTEDNLFTQLRATMECFRESIVQPSMQPAVALLSVAGLKAPPRYQ